MKNILFEELARIADKMDCLSESDSAVPKYDLFADAIYWTDEMPDSQRKNPKAYQCLRFVLRYRTSVMLNAPEADFADCWVEAKKLFPNWPGFADERQSANEDLRKFYEDESTKAMDEMESRFG